MSSLKAAFYLWKAYQYYWLGSNTYQYAQTAWKCYSLTHPTIRWCYQKIYSKNPESWNDELRRKEYRLLAELDALRQEKEEGVKDKNYEGCSNSVRSDICDDWLMINTNQ